MKINIIAVGTLSKEFQSLYNDYVKKISFFAKINLIQIKEQKLDNINQKIKKETELILEKIPKNSQVIYLSLQGEQVSSEEFGDYFLDTDNITFVIGGSNGVKEEKFKNKICFSKMTFPHQLFRVMLVEQIYRSFTIRHNIKYHK
ncbi:MULTISPECIES: 23S rRNA (pseudouridine(1915)-N(3))-methyltransferase RlmH [unclassified Mycoplasma]|uniref:23S rRNA (pseudouridine(1915)-N(3))-methyltransferase RlmH n=1 Tax=unclassified Mycoplasma TaxID=2683645 RepID=UPI00211B9A5C|nr:MULTISPECIES: 23S rRNA (pseudouridine(1915)-N(3))-methyltransferase RlmH [unclassified Mycoplasma]UUM20079.1 23S rRNA (pseudouridine(1915)-N(3))-methyltransferase RlmH [Mycoplasma sp. 1578d]UUM25059.1 23S rRNA (pseudouridine(1915)-N(3))-methyltransferase RlmH [Mycoplasma sp. 3686d]